MNFRSFFHKILFATLFLLNTISFVTPKIYIGQIKGFVDVLNPKYEYLSPIHGAMLWETSYVENLYRFAPTSSTKKLIKELFFLQFDGVTFDATSHPLLPAYSFDSKIIGKLVGTFVEYQNKLEKLKEFESTEDYQKIIQQKKQWGEEIRKLSTTIKKLQKSKKEDEKELPEVIEQKKATISKIREIENQINQIKTR